MIRALLVLISLFAIPALASGPCDELLSARVHLQQKWVGGQISEATYRLENRILDEKQKSIGIKNGTVIANKAPVSTSESPAKPKARWTKRIQAIPQEQFENLKDHHDFQSAVGGRPKVVQVSDDANYVVIETLIGFEKLETHFNVVDVSTGNIVNQFIQPDDIELAGLKDFSASPKGYLLLKIRKSGAATDELMLYRKSKSGELFEPLPDCPKNGVVRKAQFNSDGSRIIVVCSNSMVFAFDPNRLNKTHQLGSPLQNRYTGTKYKVLLVGFSAEGDYYFGPQLVSEALSVDIYNSEDFGFETKIDLDKHIGLNFNEEERIQQIEMSNGRLLVRTQINNPDNSTRIKFVVYDIDIESNELLDKYTIHSEATQFMVDPSWKQSLIDKVGYMLHRNIKEGERELAVYDLETGALVDTWQYPKTKIVHNFDSTNMHLLGGKNYLSQFGQKLYGFELVPWRVIDEVVE